MHIRNGVHWVRITDLILADAPLWRYTVEDPDTGVVESFDVNDTHACKDASGEWMKVRDLVSGDLLHAHAGGFLRVVDARALGHGRYVAMEVEGHEYTLGAGTCHNPVTL